MEVAIISCFCIKSDNCRPYLAYKYFKENYDVKIIYSNFNHSEKQYKIYNDTDMIPIHSLSYEKNVSLKRIVSHIKFSLDALKELKKHKPNLVYVHMPPNILGMIITQYCRSNKIEVMCDVVDLWPEAFPISGKIGRVFNYTFGIVWRGLRNYSLQWSTYCIAESEYFINKFLNKYKVKLVNLSKIGKAISYNNEVDKHKIIIGYLGSISNIYDFESLISICNKIKLNKDLEVKIVGDGEKREWLLRELKNNNIKYNYYGKVFEEKQKQEILRQCTFGYNGYKQSTEVALSYKSLDYLYYGIPLINSTKGDTSYLVEKYNIGFNFNHDNINEVSDRISQLNEKDIIDMKKKCIEVFNSMFSWESYKKAMDNIIKSNYKNEK